MLDDTQTGQCWYGGCESQPKLKLSRYIWCGKFKGKKKLMEQQIILVCQRHADLILGQPNPQERPSIQERL